MIFSCSCFRRSNPPVSPRSVIFKCSFMAENPYSSAQTVQIKTDSDTEVGKLRKERNKGRKHFARRLGTSKKDADLKTEKGEKANLGKAAG